MADANNAETGAAQKTSETTQVVNANTADANNQAEKPLTLTDLKSILGEFRNGINADIRKATKAPMVATTAQPEVKTEELTLKEQFAAFRTERDTEKAALAAERRENALMAAVNSLPDLDDESREMLLAFIERKHGARITVDGKNVVYTDADQSTQSVKDLVKSVFESVGKKFVRGETVPTARALAGTGQTGKGSAAHPMSKMTMQEIMKHPDGAMRSQFMREHREEFEKKEQEYYRSKGF